jgi:cellulose 1,4-beta-cellobiosidase
MRRLLVGLLVGLFWLGMAHAANLTFAWDAPTTNADNSTPVDVTGYRLYCRLPTDAYSAFVDVGNVLTGTFTGLTANTLYYCAVRAYDAAANLGPFGQEGGNFTGPTTPTAPTFFRMVAMACREVRLRWERSTDDLAVTEYRVRRNGAQVGTTAGTVRLYDDSGLSPSTGYTYVVRAADASANESSDSNSVVLTTPACQ